MNAWKTSVLLLLLFGSLVFTARLHWEKRIIRVFCQDVRDNFSSVSRASQESIQLLKFPFAFEVLPESVPSVAVRVSDEALGEISSSVLGAEAWLRSHVLSRYPSKRITTIVVFGHASCLNSEDNDLGIAVLSSLKNIHYSLKRWGLEKEIRVSPVFSSSCLDPISRLFEFQMFESVIRPMFLFLQNINSTYTLDPPPDFSMFSENTIEMLQNNMHFMKNFKGLSFNTLNVLLRGEEDQKEKHLSRKLISYTNTKIIDPYPARPSPLPKISPIHPSVGYSAPATAARSPEYPQPGFLSPSPFSFPSDSPPPTSTPTAPLTYPPCSPAYSTEPEGLWCVAKPNVPDETLQEAMDFACGDGGGDCNDISPNGICFLPNTVVAHASYAFNSYWQKRKGNGGTCNFGGTAMLINSDPSFLGCRFVLA